MNILFGSEIHAGFSRARVRLFAELHFLPGAIAVRLFVTRARAVDQTFDLTADNSPVVADICSGEHLVAFHVDRLSRALAGKRTG
jgi:predicted ATPase